jgi:hypothetical protein
MSNSQNADLLPYEGYIVSMHPDRFMGAQNICRLLKSHTFVPIQICRVVIPQVDVDIATHVKVSSDGPDQR